MPNPRLRILTPHRGMDRTDPTPNDFGSRAEFHEWIKTLGYRPRDSVTKKTDLLLVGPEWGRVKLEKAMKYGTPIIPYTFPLAIGFFSSRQGSSLSDPILEQLTLYTLTLADALHGHYHLTSDGRAGDACRLIVGVVQRLLLISRGPIGERDVERSEEPSWANPESLAEIVKEIDTAWRLAIGFLEVMSHEES